MSLPPPQIVLGDAFIEVARLRSGSVDLVLTSPPYADARASASIAPDAYVAWFLPLMSVLAKVLTPQGSVVLNLKNRVAKSGQFKGQRHPWVRDLVSALQRGGTWKLIDECVWHCTNAMPGLFGPRAKNAWEPVFHFALTLNPYWDIDAVRVPYRTKPAEVRRRLTSTEGRRETISGFGRTRARTYARGGADPGNVLAAPQVYNQHYGPAGKHDAVMPEAVAQYWVRAASPPGGLVIDPFAGSGTTLLVATQEGRRAWGCEIRPEAHAVAVRRVAAGDGGTAPAKRTRHDRTREPGTPHR